MNLTGVLTPLIDCHVLHLAGEREDWRKECDASLADVGPLVKVHHMDGIPGDYKAARRFGFFRGSAPFVSFADPDDMVWGCAFAQCLGHITDSDAAVWTASLVMRGALVEPAHHARPHQLIVARRTAVEAALCDGPMDDRNLWEAVGRFGKVRHLPQVMGYVWRDHRDGHHWRGDDWFLMRNRQSSSAPRM